VPAVEAVLEGSAGRKQATLGLSPLVIGSAPECDLVTEDEGVSRQHLRVMLTERGVSVRDLGSKNGTFLNGVQIIEAPVPKGAVVTFGRARLSLLASGETKQLALWPSARFGSAVGASVAMREVFARLARAADTSDPVLLLGESGTGKEVLARSLHAEGARRDKAFIVVDCTALAPQLIEAELFGHAKGAFSGADQAREGLFAAAHGGTLFLDEIGELPLDLQPRLLRAVQSGEIRPVGNPQHKKVDVRVIAATHPDLRGRAASGKFRSDLYYRLAALEVVVPPLRERREDIPLLVEQFLSEREPKAALADLPANALELLQAGEWPGNARELRNTVARLLLHAHLGDELMQVAAPKGTVKKQPEIAKLPLREARDAVLEDFERRYLAAQLEAHGGNVAAAAEAMGVSRQFAYRLVARYGLRGSS
jgi:transcriptional regulator with PAS, ATPase and Fis domain